MQKINRKVFILSLSVQLIPGDVLLTWKIIQKNWEESILLAHFRKRVKNQEAKYNGILMV